MLRGLYRNRAVEGRAFVTKLNEVITALMTGAGLSRSAASQVLADEVFNQPDAHISAATTVRNWVAGTWSVPLLTPRQLGDLAGRVRDALGLQDQARREAELRLARQARQQAELREAELREAELREGLQEAGLQEAWLQEEVL